MFLFYLKIQALVILGLIPNVKNMRWGRKRSAKSSSRERKWMSGAWGQGKVDIKEDLKLVEPEGGRRPEEEKAGHGDHREAFKEAFLPTEN